MEKVLSALRCIADRRTGTDPSFLTEAVALGEAIAAAGLGLVYGGASVGLMGAVADAALAGGAEVIGVLPEVLSGSEIAHRGLTRLEIVQTMHERKARMVKLADAFLMLPGGYGTLDEMMEIVTWKQLRLHAKPCILINTAGYWDGLLAFLDRAVEAGFLKAENRELLQVAATAGCGGEAGGGRSGLSGTRDSTPTVFWKEIILAFNGLWMGVSANLRTDNLAGLGFPRLKGETWGTQICA